MNNLLSLLLRHKGIFIPLMILLIAAFLYLPTSKKTGGPTVEYPTPTIVPLNPATIPGKIFEGKKATIGQTTDSQLRILPGLEKEEASADGGRTFIFTSSILPRPNTVSTNQSGIAVFERVVTIGSTDITLSQAKSLLGEEEFLIEGSSFYGKAINTYIYSSRGVAILANPNTDDIYEIQTFQPTNVSEYINRYSDKGNITNPQEGS